MGNSRSRATLHLQIWVVLLLLLPGTSGVGDCHGAKPDQDGFVPCHSLCASGVVGAYFVELTGDVFETWCLDPWMAVSPREKNNKRGINSF
jgi:hypothetical protein